MSQFGLCSDIRVNDLTKRIVDEFFRSEGIHAVGGLDPVAVAYRKSVA